MVMTLLNIWATLLRNRTFNLTHKIMAVRKFSTCTSQRKVCSLLGLAGYYKRFIRDFSKMAKPMTVLT